MGLLPCLVARSVDRQGRFLLKEGIIYPAPRRGPYFTIHRPYSLMCLSPAAPGELCAQDMAIYKWAGPALPPSLPPLFTFCLGWTGRLRGHPGAENQSPAGSSPSPFRPFPQSL